MGLHFLMNWNDGSMRILYGVVLTSFLLSGCGGAERSEGFAVVFFVTSEEVVPAVVNELPEGGGAGTAGLVDGRHKKCS